VSFQTVPFLCQVVVESPAEVLTSAIRLEGLYFGIVLGTGPGLKGEVRLGKLRFCALGGRHMV